MELRPQLGQMIRGAEPVRLQHELARLALLAHRREVHPLAATCAPVDAAAREAVRGVAGGEQPRERVRLIVRGAAHRTWPLIVVGERRTGVNKGRRHERSPVERVLLIL